MNPTLDTNAVTVEGILYWSYGISNRWGGKGIDYYPETQGRMVSRMEDLRVEAAMVQRVVNRELRWPHLRAIIEAKYGEREESVRKCAMMLKKTATGQSTEAMIRLVEHFCLIRKYPDRAAMMDLGSGKSRCREVRSRYEGVLFGWEWFALDALEESFRERGWVE